MQQVLLHCCCAPCSAAIIEWMMANGFRPTLFYYNPNIYPLEEYQKRKDELTRYAAQLTLDVIDADYDHLSWHNAVCHLADEPERGARCQLCFDMRLLRTAQTAQRLGIGLFATTLASSRWKSIEQISRAGQRAQEQVDGTQFFDRNWRKGGLQQRRAELLRQNGFYNQQYCGCEYSMR